MSHKRTSVETSPPKIEKNSFMNSAMAASRRPAPTGFGVTIAAMESGLKFKIDIVKKFPTEATNNTILFMRLKIKLTVRQKYVKKIPLSSKEKINNCVFYKIICNGKNFVVFLGVGA